MGMPLYLTSKVNRCAGSAATIVHLVDQRRQPSRLAPLNRTPGAGPVAPPSQRQPVVSGLHRPMFVASLTRWYRVSGVASIFSSTVTSGMGEVQQEFEEPVVDREDAGEGPVTEFPALLGR